jgi:predicted chitinase
MAKNFINTLDATQKKHLSIIVDTLKNNGYTNPLTIAGICSIISKESVFKLVRENMNYSASRIGEVWPRLKKKASSLGGNPEALANEVYGNKYGNGPKDGYKYRGGGFNQLTFKALYTERGKQTGTDLGNDPDLIANATVAAKVLVHYYKDSFKTLAKDKKLQQYGASDLNGFTNLKDAICAAYHATAGIGKKVSDVKGLLTSDSLGGMTKAQANGPDLLTFVKQFTGYNGPPEEVTSNSSTPSDGGTTGATAETPPVAPTPKLPPDPSKTIAKIKLVKKSGPGELMGVTEFDAYIGEAPISGLQFDEPGEYVIQAIGDDDRIISTEFKITVTGEPNPKSSDKPIDEKKDEGSRPIIAQIDPTAVVLKPIEFPLLEADAQTNIEVVNGVGLTPFLWFNGYQIKELDIKSLSLFHDGMVPSCQAQFKDTTGVIQKDGFPLDDTTFEVFLNSGSPNLKSIHMKFKLTNFQENTDKTYTVTGSIDLRDFYKIKYQSYVGTSFEVLRAISKELQLGFNSNIQSTDDTMKWTNPGKKYREFIGEVLRHSYITDESFVLGYIDFYYCFNYVDIEKEWIRDIKSDVGVSSGSLSRLATAKTEEKIVKLILTNEKSSEGTDVYFQTYNVKNNSTAKSIEEGQKSVSKYYDTSSKSFLVFDIESQTSPGDDKIILKGKPDDSSELKENYRTVFCGKIDLDNVHKNYPYAKVLNERNLNELNKISVDIEMSSCNFNLYKFQKINIQFIMKAQSPSNPEFTQERISGDWMITDIKYIWMSGKLKQNLTCVRKELEKTAEEKQNQTTEAQKETKSGNDNTPNEAKPPNSIFAVDETYTVKNKEGRIYTITVQKLLENGDEIQGYVIENIEQPDLIKPVPVAASQSGSTASTAQDVSKSVIPPDPNKPKVPYKLYVEPLGVIFSYAEGSGSTASVGSYIGDVLWSKIKSMNMNSSLKSGTLEEVSILQHVGDKNVDLRKKGMQEKITQNLYPFDKLGILFVEGKDSTNDIIKYASPETFKVNSVNTTILKILISDDQGKIDAWVKKNGIGIKHDSKNVQATIDALEKLMNS